MCVCEDGSVLVCVYTMILTWFCLSWANQGGGEAKMAVPLLSKRIVKKRVKQFKRPQSDRKISVKVSAFLVFVDFSVRSDF